MIKITKILAEFKFTLAKRRSGNFVLMNFTIYQSGVGDDGIRQ